MIKANELRIGNYIEISKGEFKQVFSGMIPLIEEMCEIPAFANTSYPSYPKAIPLTPEILEGCGFKKHVWDNGLSSGIIYTNEINDFMIQYSINHSSHNTFVIVPDSQDECSEINIIKMCKYLHQLQNLYFAFIGQELNINLNVETLK